MINEPLVTVLCLSYNHAPFLREALDSVYQQTHTNLQVILIDNKSEDNSSKILQEYYEKYSTISHLVLNDENKGNCQAINDVLPLVKGEYIVDFATDDVFYPNRLERQLQTFQNLSNDYGLVFTNAEMIDENSQKTGLHTDNKNVRISTGNVYKDIVERYFLCPPTMLVRKEVFDKLQGYDANLAYEDYDFLVRSSRIYKFHFLDEVLTKRRVLENSMHSLFSAKNNYKMIESTYLICEKVYQLNETVEEHKALAKRIHHEMKYALKSKHYGLVEKYEILLNKLEMPSLSHRVLFGVSKVLKKIQGK